jgi:hypothetical protein
MNLPVPFGPVAPAASYRILGMTVQEHGDDTAHSIATTAHRPVDRIRFELGEDASCARKSIDIDWS